jgi:PKHD-type hydroxylase
MMLQIPELLDQDQLRAVRQIIDVAEWIDGNATSGVQAAMAKNNLQLPEGSDAARRAGDIIQTALGRNPAFMSAALPLKVFPPLFNRYGTGQYFKTHVDNAVRHLRGTDFRIRSDLSATVFLNDPTEYDGGELSIEDTYGIHRVKLPAGSMVLYPASSLHHVSAITRGERLGSFFWIQSMVREDANRSLLFQLDASIQELALDKGQDHPAIVRLTGIYHNLIRQYADL